LKYALWKIIKTVQLQQGSQLYPKFFQEEYQIIAEEINERKDIGLFCIQHEFGLLAGNTVIMSLHLY
jgi:hypothetical protein